MSHLCLTLDAMHAMGKCQFPCTYKNTTNILEFQVVDADVHAVIGLRSCQDMHLIQRVWAVQSTPVESPSVLEEYQDVFQGLGCLEGQYHITVDPNIKPVVHAPRKVPIALYSQVKTELDRMEKLDAIAKVEGPSDWVNSMVVVVKPNKLRICLGPRDLNRAIKREHFPMLTVEEVAARMPEAKIFTVLDASTT